MIGYDYAGRSINSFKSVPWISEMHRGYSSSTVYENTIPAYYRAWENGANSIETDARLSSDGIYVVCHDPTITVNGTTYTIANETAATLTSLVLSNDSEYGECKIPTLKSVLQFCLFTGMMVNIDCKEINAETLATLVVDSGMSGRALYSNVTTSAAATILGIDPNAGFCFPYSAENITSWSTALQNYETKSKSYAWGTTISYEILRTVRENGFKYLLTEVSAITNMHFSPDCIEFVSTVNSNDLNNTFLKTIDLLDSDV